MDLSQALMMQAMAWGELQKLTASLCETVGHDYPLLDQIDTWSRVHAAACRQLDQLRQEEPKEDFLASINDVYQRAKVLLNDGGLTKDNVYEVLESIEELIDHVEG